MPEPQPTIVGRQSEVERFASLIAGRTPHYIRATRKSSEGVEDAARLTMYRPLATRD
jgi:hypothetical protein